MKNYLQAFLFVQNQHPRCSQFTVWKMLLGSSQYDLEKSRWYLPLSNSIVLKFIEILLSFHIRKLWKLFCMYCLSTHNFEEQSFLKNFETDGAATSPSMLLNKLWIVSKAAIRDPACSAPCQENRLNSINIYKHRNHMT